MMVAEKLKRLADWFINSDIQSKEIESKGGVYAWFDLDNKAYSFVYPEITGYAITTLVFLNESLKDGKLLDKAKLAADWLIDKAFDKKRNCFRYRYDVNTHSFRERAYTFDEGIILNGLVNLYRLIGQDKYLDFAKVIANRLIYKLQRENGSFKPFEDLAETYADDRPKKWSRQAGSFLVKNVIGLLNLYDIEKDEKIKAAALKACEYALSFQDEKGRFITNFFDKSTHLHPHSYTAEGLWVAGIVLNDRKFIVASTKAIKWSLDNQLVNGGIPRIFIDGKFNTWERTDVLAQTIRMASILIGNRLLGDDYPNKVDKAVNRLMNFQYNSNDSQDGGILFGFQGDGRKANQVNSWCTMFSLQALDIYLRFYKEKLDFDWHLFI